MADNHATPAKDSTSQNNGWCSCPRQGDLWRCKARVLGQPLPAVRNEAGECCALRFVCDVTGRDAWDLAADQLIERTPCEGCGGASRG